MNESEVRTIFFKIENRYNFPYDDHKVEEWREDLEDIPYETALLNLKRYCRNPENKYAPHLGVLAEIREEAISQVKGTEETAVMLDKHGELEQQSIPMPAYVKEMVEKLARKRF